MLAFRRSEGRRGRLVLVCERPEEFRPLVRSRAWTRLNDAGDDRRDRLNGSDACVRARSDRDDRCCHDLNASMLSCVCEMCSSA